MPGSHSENVPSAPAQPFYSSMPGAATRHCVSPTRTQFQGGRPASTIMLEVHLPILAPDYTPDCTAAQGQGSTLGLGLFIHSQQSSGHLGSAGCEGLIGCAWAAMLAMPFTFVTNALQGYGHMGAYLGLFNGTICIPQIVAALLGGVILTLVGDHQSTMMIVAGVFFLIGAACVGVIRDKK